MSNKEKNLIALRKYLARFRVTKHDLCVISLLGIRPIYIGHLIDLSDEIIFEIIQNPDVLISELSDSEINIHLDNVLKRREHRRFRRGLGSAKYENFIDNPSIKLIINPVNHIYIVNFS
jgi:hypothetical protein